MKRKFRIIVGMLLLAIPLCMNAQVKPGNNETTKPGVKPKKEKVEPKNVDNAEKPEKTIKAGKTENTDKSVKVGKTEKPDKPTKAVKPESPEKPENPEKPKGGLEMPKISGFVQGLYQANLSDKGDLIDNTLRMRRVRMSIEGKLSKTVSYKIQGDFVRSPMLVDGFVKYKPCNEFAIQVGQFKTPFSLESPINPVNLEIFDYGENVQQLVGYSDVCGIKAIGRDIGIMATGSLFPMVKNGQIAYNLVDYAVGVFNGNGVNVVDNNNRKDVVGRLEVHPGMKDLTLSGSYYYGKYKTSDDHGVRNRWSAGAQYNDGKLVVRGEYFDGTTGYHNDIVDPEGNPIEQYRFSNGYYAVAGYNFKVGEQKVMPVLRYEHFEPGDMNSTVYGGTNWYTVGVNYWILKQLNFKFDYSLVERYVSEKAYSHRVVGILSYKF